MSKKNIKVNDEDSLDFIELFSNLWINKIFIFKITLLFFFIGIAYSLSLKHL